MFLEIALIGGAVTYWRKRHPKKPQPSEQTAKHSKRFSFKQLLNDIKTSVGDDERQQLLDSMELNEELKKAQRTVNRDLIISTAAVSCALLGRVSPMFPALSVVSIVYLARSIFRFMWRDFKAGNFFSVYLLNAVLLFGMIASGSLIAAAMAGLIGGFFIKLLEKTESNSKKHLINVFAGHPSKVWVAQDGVEIQVEFTQININDSVIVNAGEIIPVDGIIQEGLATIDQHILTGESQPVEKAPGDKVFAATLLLSGRIRVLVETAGEDCVAAQIGQVLNNTQNYKDTLTARGKKIADSCLPIELGISALALPLLGVSSALTVLWSGLGANMVSLGPLSVLSYLQLFSRQGILIKDGRVLESLRQVDTVIFDKTGTLTLEQPTVGKIHCLSDDDENTVLRLAAAAEFRQTHPVAKAIIELALGKNLELPVVDTASYEVGYGIKVMLDGRHIRVGSRRFMNREGIELPETSLDIQTQAESNGYSLIYVAIDQLLAGILEMQPTIRPEAFATVKFLKQRGMKLIIISGDHEQPTRNMATRLGIDHYLAEVLPGNKAEHVKKLTDEGRFVCFIGDGINDAIALKAAQVSISLKGASTAATDTAQIIFMDGTLNHLQQLFQIADEFEDTMHTNFLTTLVPGVICMGGVFFLNFGIAAGMGLFYAGSAVGLVNTLWPLVKYQAENRSQHAEECTLGTSTTQL